MLKIAFCDDELSILNQLSGLLEKYRDERGYELEYTAFQSPLELLAGVERGLRYDVILLDMLMPGECGLDAARELRTLDSSVKLIFLTSSSEFAVQSYKVNAFYYYLKPIVQESFFSLLDQVFNQCAQDRNNKLVLKLKSGITSLSLSSLEYCEVMNHTLLLHTADGKVLEGIGKLDELSKRLDCSRGFLRIHRSYLVNMAYIQNISGREITMSSGTVLPLPHGKYGEVKDAFLAYAFEKEQVLL